MAYTYTIPNYIFGWCVGENEFSDSFSRPEMKHLQECTPRRPWKWAKSDFFCLIMKTETCAYYFIYSSARQGAFECAGGGGVVLFAHNWNFALNRKWLLPALLLRPVQVVRVVLNQLGLKSFSKLAGGAVGSCEWHMAELREKCSS